MSFDPGLPLTALREPIGFAYGDDIIGPDPEIRRLDDIRASLMDPASDGPDDLYAIVMDVMKPEHRDDLVARHLLYGVVTYAQGQIGREPIRSQGHIHKVSPHSNTSTPELYEIWEGTAVILMQETDQDDPGRCFAVEAGVGEVVVVPPGWAHATISADPGTTMTFGAWCDRAYGFVYDGIRAHGGMAWFPTVVDGSSHPMACRIPAYLEQRTCMQGSIPAPRTTASSPVIPIYRQYEQGPRPVHVDSQNRTARPRNGSGSSRRAAFFQPRSSRSYSAM